MQHHPHHSQGPAPPQHHPRPSSIVHQQHHQAPPPQSQHPSAYSSTHSIQPSYQSAGQPPSSQHAQDLPYYAHQSPYSTPGTTSGYASAGKSFMLISLGTRCNNAPRRRVGPRNTHANTSHRSLRHDGRSTDASTIPADVVPHAAVQLASLGRIAIRARPAPQYLRTATVAASAAAVHVLWRPTAPVFVDARPVGSLSLPATRPATSPVHVVAI